jgi:hypothetical protein
VVDVPSTIDVAPVAESSAPSGTPSFSLDPATTGEAETSRKPRPPLDPKEARKLAREKAKRMEKLKKAKAKAAKERAKQRAKDARKKQRGDD